MDRISLLTPIGTKKGEKKTGEVKLDFFCKHCNRNCDFYPLYQGIGKDKKKVGEICFTCHWVYPMLEDGGVDRSKMVYVSSVPQSSPVGKI